VLLFVGGEVTISNSVLFATNLGIAPTIVGLFVVAVGTSMPELITSAIAAMRGESDLALGNVVGSNIFNSLLVLPVSAVVSPVPVPAGGIGDLLISWLLAALLIPLFLFGRARLSRGMGAVLLLGYAAYAVLRVTTA
jgi:cation:H+ antiporter